MFKDNREEQERINARKLLEAKIEDRYEFAVSKNKITHTDFLNMAEKMAVQKFLKEKSIQNYLFFGGNGEESERNILLFYPEKFSKQMVEKNFSKIISAIRITLPKQLHYEHKMYLSAIVKLGVKREKVGDIFVRENSTDIIVLNEMAMFLKNNLQQLTRFQKANCDIIDIQDVEPFKKQFENLEIIVSSMRLDNFVSELARCSRTKSCEILDGQRVFVNYEMETKGAKKIQIGDTITIRGKGKFIVEEMKHKTKTEKYVINLKKFI